MADTDTALIEVEGLVKRYGDRTAVDGVDLNVRPGEIFGLLGPNGAGKTTTILTLLGLTEPTEGRVRVCGLDPARDAVAVKRKAGYLPDTVGFYDNLTARQNLRYTARLNEVDSAEDLIDELIATVGLSAEADLAVGTFSRGMRQRLGVADAILKDPDVVILDEPTASIDPAGVIEILTLISNLAHRDGRAVLLSSHLLNQVQEVCDRVGIFVEGRMVAQGTPEGLATELSDGGAVYELWVDTPEERLRDALYEGPEQSPLSLSAAGPGRYRVVLRERDISGVLRSLVRAEIDVRQMRDLGSNLDQIYRQYFTETEETDR
ncbi:MAG: ABC transporter ATP-binding protein [Acidimicrobiia bacterium]|jgi:ABC-2 type transport system ATP-binding protein